VKDDDDDDVSEPANDVPAAYVSIAEALEQSGFTAVQLRALVAAGIIRTERARRGGALLYSVEDINRFEGMPRNSEPAEQSPLVAELNAITAGYRSMLELALKQTKQAQDHERQLITAFSKPLDNLGEGSKALVGAVIEQNKQLVQRATDGDAARLDFVKAAETMLRDQRSELREQSELDRKHEMRREVWDGVKKAAPHLLEGLKATAGSKRLEAAAKLKEKLDPAKVAALIRYELIGSEEVDLLCTALELDRASIEALNAAVDQAEAAPAAPEAAE
jgi:hypothetical protein